MPWLICTSPQPCPEKCLFMLNGLLAAAQRELPWGCTPPPNSLDSWHHCRPMCVFSMCSQAIENSIAQCCFAMTSAFVAVSKGSHNPHPSFGAGARADFRNPDGGRPLKIPPIHFHRLHADEGAACRRCGRKCIANILEARGACRWTCRRRALWRLACWQCSGSLGSL
jgi:hypothetical protein